MAKSQVIEKIRGYAQTIIFKWANPGLLFLFPSFQAQIFTEKNVGFSGIRTRIVRVEGEHSDHLTTTTAHAQTIISLPFPFALQLQCLLFLHYYSLSLSLSLSHHPLPLSRNVLKMK